MCAAATPEEFNPQALLQTLAEQYELRFREAGIPEESIPRMVMFLSRMAEVSIQLAQQEKEIRIPNTEHAIPYDAHTTTRVVELFSEGIGEALLRSVQMKLPDEASDMILQNVAQYVNDTAKQVVLSTYGQENTPELQIPEEQQLELVYQTARSALDHFVQQYEEQEGVSLTEDADSMLGDVEMGDSSEMDAMLSDDDSSSEAPSSGQSEGQAPPPPQSQQQATPEPPQKKSPSVQPQQPAIPGGHLPPVVHEKLAAVSMLLNTVPQEQGQNIFNMFDPSQQDVIRFYLDPANVFQRLDMNAVLKQLHALKQRLFGDNSPSMEQKGSPQPSENITSPASSEEPTPSYRALKELSGSVPKSVLTGLVHRERLLIRQSVDDLYDDDLPVEAMLTKASTKQPKTGLPTQVEMLLSDYLQQRVS